MARKINTNLFAKTEAEPPKRKLAIYLSADVAQALEKRHHAQRMAAADSGADLRDVSRSAIVEAALRAYLAGDSET